MLLVLLRLCSRFDPLSRTAARGSVRGDSHKQFCEMRTIYIPILHVREQRITEVELLLTLRLDQEAMEEREVTGSCDDLGASSG